jgi:hypothetical protein
VGVLVRGFARDYALQERDSFGVVAGSIVKIRGSQKDFLVALAQSDTAGGGPVLIPIFREQVPGI